MAVQRKKLNEIFSIKKYDREQMMITNRLLSGVETRFGKLNPLTNQQEAWTLAFSQCKGLVDPNKSQFICLEGNGKKMWVANGLNFLAHFTGIHLKKNQSSMLNMLPPKLPKAIQAIFGWKTVAISPLPNDVYYIELNYGTADATHKTVVAMRKSEWAEVLAHPSFTSSPRVALHPTFQFRLPINLGSLTLGTTEISQLELGDLVFIENTPFSKDGGGVIELKTCKLFVHITKEKKHYSLTINSLEPTMINENRAENDDELISDDMDIGHGADRQDQGLPVTDLPIKIDVRLGSIKFTMKDLGNLVEGKLYTIDSACPGQVQLMNNDMELARGQLVEVDGKLAIEIKRRWIQN